MMSIEDFNFIRILPNVTHVPRKGLIRHSPPGKIPPMQEIIFCSSSIRKLKTAYLVYIWWHNMRKALDEPCRFLFPGGCDDTPFFISV